MSTRDDATFDRAGRLWLRVWVGGNDGRYEWRSGALVAWCAERRFAVDHRGIKVAAAAYQATVAGQPVPGRWASLVEAMDGAAKAAAGQRRAA